MSLEIPSAVSAMADKTPVEHDEATSAAGETLDKSLAEVSNESTQSAPILMTAVLFKEASIDSPTFRTSVNHLNAQLENVDRWLDSFIKATQKISHEMEGLYSSSHKLIDIVKLTWFSFTRLDKRHAFKVCPRVC